MIESLFEEIYKSTHERFVESRKINSVEEFFEKDGIRYLAGLLNGKKNIPSYFLDEKGKEYLSTVINKVLSVLKDDQYFGSDQAIAFVVKVSKTPTDLEDLLRNHFDTVIEYGKCCNSEWFKKSDYVKKIMSATEYSGEDMHRLEKYLQEEHAKRSKSKNLKSNNTALYNTLYDDGEWKLFIPKNFEGDIELASHIEPFEYEEKIYNKTRWCTAADKESYDRYSFNNKHPFYVIQHWTNGKYTDAWQIAFMYLDTLECYHIEIMDKYDKRDWNFLHKCPNEVTSKIIEEVSNISIYDILKLLEDENIKRFSERFIGTGCDIFDKTISCAINLNMIQKRLPHYKIGDVITTDDYELIQELNSPIFQAHLIIPDSMTTIIDNFISNNLSIVEVSLPDTIKKIGSHAFDGCNYLTSINIPNSVTQIGEAAFHCCGFKSITIPEGVTSIENNTFTGCSKLTSINIPNGVTQIGDLAFCWCSNLENVTIPNSVTMIGYSAFSGCDKLMSITIPMSCQYKQSSFEDHTKVIRRSNTNFDSKFYKVLSELFEQIYRQCNQ